MGLVLCFRPPKVKDVKIAEIKIDNQENIPNDLNQQDQQDNKVLFGHLFSSKFISA